MKKSIVCLILVVCLVLPGCHSQTQRETFSIPDTFDTSREYEITFWAKNDTNITQVEIYKKAIADFEAIYPNIHVKLGLYTDYGRLYNDVITNIATDTTPNVCVTYPDHIATYKTGQDSVVSLTELLTHEKYGLGGSEVRFDSPTQEEIIPKFLEECYLDGDCYALPYMRSTEVCYVNRTYVEKLGYTLPEVLTWDFIWEVSEAATRKNADGTYAINGQKVMIPFLYKSTDNMMITYLRQTGGAYSNDAGHIGIWNDTTRDFLKTIREHTQSGAFSTFKISGYPANFLNAGQCIFAIDSTAGATWMGSDAPLVDIAEDKLVDFETEVMLLPQADPENPQMMSQGPSLCVFNKSDPQEVLASWLFAQFLLTDEVQIAYAQTEGYVPVTSKAQQSAEYTDYLSRAGEDNDLYYDVKLRATQLLLDNTEHTFVTPVFNGSASLRDAAGYMIESVVKSVRRNETMDDTALENLYLETVALYRLDQSRGLRRGELGPLPTDAKILLGALGLAWLGIATWSLVTWRKKKKRT